jgi:hypothetical protein
MAVLYRRQVLCIDSRSREEVATTTPSDYLLKFPIIKNVKMVRLISSEIPNTAYIFTSANNNIDVLSNLISGGGIPAGTYTATITPGTYTGAELANEINRALNAIMNTAMGVTFTATYITFTQKIRIDRVDGGAFQLLWATGPSVGSTPYLELGYTLADTALAITSSSTNVVNLVGDNYVYLSIKEFSSTRVTDRLDDVFAKIIMNIPPRSIAFDTFASNEVIFQRPIDLKQLHITFRRRDGSLYDFNTIEHSMTMEFYTL